MPPKSLVDWDMVDRDTVFMDRQALHAFLPQRGNMAQIHGVYRFDAESGRVLGYLDITGDEFWAAGHFPEMPVLPGVMMVEAVAQLSTVLHVLRTGDQNVLGLAALREMSFRGQVSPPGRLELAVLALDKVPSTRRGFYHGQAFFQGRLVLDGKILGMPLPIKRRNAGG